MTCRIAWYGTAAVIVHTIVNILHALAHVSIPVPATPRGAVFIVTVIVAVPLVAMVSVSGGLSGRSAPSPLQCYDV
jgi:ABC-type multidrug transport system permease subunit